jgi:hypothetical protein
MSNKTRQALLNDITTFIPDNVNNEVSAADVRQRMIDLAESYPNLTDESYLLGLKEYNPANNYAIGESCIESGSIYQSISITTGTFNPAHWTVLGSDTKAFGAFVDTFMVPTNAVTVDGGYSGLTLTDSPPSNCRIDIFADGHHYECGNGSKTKPFYLSSDNGVSAVNFSGTAPGNKLYFNALIAGWDLELTDKISIIYDKIQ